MRRYYTACVARTRHAFAMDAVQLPDIPIPFFKMSFIKTWIAQSGVDESCLLILKDAMDERADKLETLWKELGIDEQGLATLFNSQQNISTLTEMNPSNFYLLKILLSSE